MAKMRYWAFISYAHEDERHAAWLQRALESYRVPSRLRKSQESDGKIPRRLAPVFRDREDFSSAPNLAQQVQSAIESSRALIVICSPSAAQSQWVNQEITRFRELNGDRQIHCLIVDGEPESTDPKEGCFPPALMAGGAIEPLAADLRKSADGKQLAKLKLIAGILGLRLDDLRHRDQQRRTRWMAGGLGAAFAIALAMAVMAFLAIEAREKAERAHAETLANYEFLLGDLQSKLVEVGRLDILEDVGEFISGQSQQKGIDALSESQQVQVALAWRQIGSVHHQRSEFEQAMDVFQRSLQIFEALESKYPENLDYLFELSQALYYVGLIHYERGEYPRALEYLVQYLEISERLYQAEPMNSGYIMEMAYAHANLFNVYERMVGSNRRQLVVHAREGVRYNELALDLEPDNAFFLSMLSETTADLADSLLKVCELGDAYLARLRNLDISRTLLTRNPRNSEYREDLGNALSGLGHIEASVGNVEQALAHYEESRQIFEDLLAQEPTNSKYRWYLVWKNSFSAELLSDLGQLDEAWVQFAETRQLAEDLMSEQKEVSIDDRIVYGRFLTAFGELAFRRGDDPQAQRFMEDGLQILVQEVGNNPDSYMARSYLSGGLVRAWIVGVDPELPGADALALDLVGESTQAMGCSDARLAVQQSVIAGNAQAAATFTRYLLGKGLWHPNLIRFCRESGGCGEPAVSLL